MSAEVTVAFSMALPGLAGSLMRLDLSSWSIGAQAATTALAPALAQATGLVEVRLGDNDLGPQGAQWLVPVLTALPHLRSWPVFMPAGVARLHSRRASPQGQGWHACAFG